MVLTDSELKSLSGVAHATPHDLLGMHPLGGSGVVVRAAVPGALSISVVPVHERSRPVIPLARLGDSMVFEGVDRTVKGVYAYDLVIRYGEGHEVRARDPYSFLPTLGEVDLHLFGEGNDRLVYNKLGAHVRDPDGVAGVSFAVWAPNARRVSVVGDFNGWDGRRHPMRRIGASGVWDLFVPGVGKGALYKFEVLDANGSLRLKADPFAFFSELAPKNASIVWDTAGYGWTDSSWLESRRGRNAFRSPMSLYEVHPGSWRKNGSGESLGYRGMAGPLIDHVRRLGFTHVEFLPLAEHAYYPSWGYQVTGFYAPTCRYGSPEDLQYLVNALHEAGIGVVVDWVPAHFPRDDWALARFDGTALYEHEDPRKGAHQDWGTLIFNFGRHEVSNFLAANALYWLDRFHVDGLRVDAVASMLYLDYSRKQGEWIPNRHGGRENLEAIDFLKRFNEWVHTGHPGVVTVAEESTAWPMVSRPPYLGGLGFSFKWNMGWMHDTLRYFMKDPVVRKYHQDDLTFAMLYHDHENFMLPLSHDEVVHGKGSLIGRMPGDDWQKFANLRALLGYQVLFPGKKLLFMGGEFGQSREWNENGELDWWLLDSGPFHRGLMDFLSDLNRFYLEEPALWEADHEGVGFRWIDCSDRDQSVLSFLRCDLSGAREVVVVMNLTPVPREGYRVGFPSAGEWLERINSDGAGYGGGNVGNLGRVIAEPVPQHGQPASGVLVLPPLSVMAFVRGGR